MQLAVKSRQGKSGEHFYRFPTDKETETWIAAINRKHKAPTVCSRVRTLLVLSFTCIGPIITRMHELCMVPVYVFMFTLVLLSFVEWLSLTSNRYILYATSVFLFVKELAKKQHQCKRYMRVVQRFMRKLSIPRGRERESPCQRQTPFCVTSPLPSRGAIPRVLMASVVKD